MPPKKKTAAPDEAQQVKPADLAAMINKQFGPGAVTMGSDPDLMVKRWPTGLVPIDYALDGGLPRGRFIEAYGPYSTLKSFFLYVSLGQVQQRGGKVGLIDTEHSFDPEWATDLGVDVDNLFVSRPETAEQGIGVLEALIRQRFDLVGFDSIAAAIPKQHQEVAPGEDTQPGALARVMSKGLARLNAANKHTTAIFINQTRSKIGVTFGPTETTSGGNAMGFYASYRLAFRRTEKINEDIEIFDGTKMKAAKQTIAHRISMTLEKSKLSAPHREVLFEFDLTNGRINNRAFLLAQGIERGLVTRSTAGHWQVPAVMDSAVHGKDKFYAFLNDNPEVEEWLLAEIMPTPTLAG